MGNERHLTVLALLLTLFPEAGIIEEKAHVTCVPQQQKQVQVYCCSCLNSPW